MAAPKEQLLAGARQAKHNAYIAWKGRRFAWSFRTEPIRRTLYPYRPYRYNPEDFAGVLEPGVATDTRVDPLPRVIHCFWTGDNRLTPRRAEAVEALRQMGEAAGIEINLVTPELLGGFVLAEEPLSDLYDKLHLVHRADYLRAYFLNFHGGGYTDLKRPLANWGPAFDRMDRSETWIVGDHKPTQYLTPVFPDRRLERLMRRTSPLHIFQCAFIARPKTPLTQEWWRLLNVKLEASRPDLERHPGVGRTGGEHYPLAWTELLGQIIDPLTVKYAEHVDHASELALSQHDYQ